MEIYPISDNSNINTAAKIVAIGVGGCGCNQVRDLFKRGISGVDYVIANTDSQSLQDIASEINGNVSSILLGSELCKGLGTGGDPQVGKLAAEESKEEILQKISDNNIVFVCAGMGKGTGTGAAPYIAKLAKEQGALTISVVAKCSIVDGKKRLLNAEDGIKQLLNCSDTLIAVPNDKIRKICKGCGFTEAYSMANEILANAIICIVKIIHNKAYIKADLNDIRTALKDSGHSLIGRGISSGENAHLEALDKALNSPWLDNYKIRAESTILLHLECSEEYGIESIYEIQEKLQESIEEGIDIITAITLTDKKEFDVTIVAPAIVEETIKENEKPTNAVSIPQEENVEVAQQQKILNTKLVSAEVENKLTKTFKKDFSKNRVSDLFEIADITDNNQNNPFNSSITNSNITNSRYNDLSLEEQKKILNVPTALRNDFNNTDVIPTIKDLPPIQSFVNRINQSFNNNVNRSPFIFEMNK